MSSLPVLGVIGCGNMGSAILKGLGSLDQALFSLVAFDRNQHKLEALRPLGVKGTSSMAELVKVSDWLIFAIKPQQLLSVLESLGESLKDKVIVSIAAGVSLNALEKASCNNTVVFRVMPNTPATVGEGVFAICYDESKISEIQKKVIVDLFNSLGRAVILPEAKFNAFSALIGCGPAYVFYQMEALVEAGVSLGLSRAESTLMVVDLFYGSVVLAKESGKHLSVLREEVCSPGGMTIAGINKFDSDGIKGKLIEAVFAAYQKGKKMEEDSAKESQKG
ncbi:pyrroline-5-carboxylate reductase [Desulfovibrio litoralis]|uniref:Pyrroline-5-carboxylate reductase n=1 Tax=Desulfovibrio litoralis DSM 11393 TaxID=1121455 RepID=A0A1M7S9I2_9BACT|nr:pyrroline-5-carboxylate reductase [Desulfovibrio litoralis]SHN55103.1 pyrroline-5-carboxylate reductase [Desulfovibrio litoralis DSM 11393]